MPSSCICFSSDFGRSLHPVPAAGVFCEFVVCVGDVSIPVPPLDEVDAVVEAVELAFPVAEDVDDPLLADPPWLGDVEVELDEEFGAAVQEEIPIEEKAALPFSPSFFTEDSHESTGPVLVRWGNWVSNRWVSVDIL